ncbi:hypothetical protein [Pseudactinotalea sp. HY158]|uniref:hypothetical protein n=1 Tax=Pseudactinotalea sp. HY158 TaxID=2654547 RepID=UPI00129C76E7|nr:hypothetical protein [Pseudactinotalea sp. HY158]QGH69755.1 hypothetical protein GCE65_09705 [Pseudactinotalea sp. HY158]
MITITTRDDVRLPGSSTARFVGDGPDNLQMLCIHASPTIIQEFVTPPRTW